MDYKIFIVVLAICYLEILGEKPWYCERPDFLDSFENQFFPKVFPEELKCEWAEDEIENFATNVSLFGMKKYIDPHLHSKAADCYYKQHEEYVNFVINFTENINTLRTKLRAVGPQKYMKFVEQARNSLHSVIKPIILLKYRLMSDFSEGNYAEVSELLKNSTRDIKKGQVKFFLTMNNLRPGNYKYVKEGERHFRKLRKEAKEKSNDILKKFEHCVNSV